MALSDQNVQDLHTESEPESDFDDSTDEDDDDADIEFNSSGRFAFVSENHNDFWNALQLTKPCWLRFATMTLNDVYSIYDLASDKQSKKKRKHNDYLTHYILWKFSKYLDYSGNRDIMRIFMELTNEQLHNLRTFILGDSNTLEMTHALFLTTDFFLHLLEHGIRTEFKKGQDMSETYRRSYLKHHPKWDGKNIPIRNNSVERRSWSKNLTEWFAPLHSYIAMKIPKPVLCIISEYLCIKPCIIRSFYQCTPQVARQIVNNVSIAEILTRDNNGLSSDLIIKQMT